MGRATTRRGGRSLGWRGRARGNTRPVIVCHAQRYITRREGFSDPVRQFIEYAIRGCFMPWSRGQVDGAGRSNIKFYYRPLVDGSCCECWWRGRGVGIAAAAAAATPAATASESEQGKNRAPLALCGQLEQQQLLLQQGECRAVEQKSRGFEEHAQKHRTM